MIFIWSALVIVMFGCIICLVLLWRSSPPVNPGNILVASNGDPIITDKGEYIHVNQ